MARGGLGKGLKSLIAVPEGMEEKPSNNVATVEKTKEVIVNEPLMVKIRELDPNKDQPRKVFEEEALKELSDSIKQYGVVQPLVVKKVGKRYEIIAGERRWRAAKLAGLKEVPVIVKEYTEQEITEIALIENIQRENLNPVEEARAYKRLAEDFGLKQDEIAKKVSKNRASVANSMRLLKLDDEVLNRLESGELSTGHAKVILSLEDSELQKKAAEIIITGELSVRQAEKIVKDLMKPEKEAKEKPELQNTQEYNRIKETLCEKLGTKVEIKRKAENKGKIEIDYYSFEELERILEAMGTFEK